MGDTPPAYRAAQHIIEDTEGLREEIEERTRNGETCKQIADALQVKGINVSSKTISRRRVEWGLRKRVYKLGYTPIDIRGRVSRVRARVPGEEVSLVGRENRDYRKEEIFRLSNEGKTAEEIAAILEEQGVNLKGGASTVLRLQTVWRLIPYDSDRANGRGRFAKYRQKPKPDDQVKKTAGRKKKAKEPEEPVPVMGPTLHYPVNCSFGTYRRIAAGQTQAPHGQPAQMALQSFADDPIQIDSGADSDSDGGAEPLPMYDGYSPQFAETSMIPVPERNAGHQSQPASSTAQQGSDANGNSRPSARPRAQPAASQTIVQSMDVMSAELLVDLATSSLAAANKLKGLMIAVQLQRPAPDSLGVLPPSAEDIATARRKFVEAARIAVDLALDEPA
ncbi:hypothetical protein LTR85_008701 [Meristemomyces frigidus]|nr:hypothetical protein LTR85_008701 [Meristemomyces frigidus]